MILYAIFGGAGWGLLGVFVFVLAKYLTIGFKTRWMMVFLALSVISWIVEIGLVFVPPNNKWKKYDNYKKAIGSGVAKLDCYRNGTNLSMPDPSTDILYVELGGNWYPNEAAAKPSQKKIDYGFKYMSVPILHGGPLKCEFDPPIFATCIEKSTKPCFGLQYGFTMLRRATVTPYTDGWLLNKIPGYKANKENHWEWDVGTRQEAIDFVDQTEKDEDTFWIIAASIHFFIVFCCACVSLCTYCKHRESDVSTEPSIECDTTDTQPDKNESSWQ